MAQIGMSARIIPISLAQPQLFSPDAIDRAIARAADKLGPGDSGIVLHLDNQDQITASVIERIGDHVKVEGAALWDVSNGFKVDKEHLRVEGDLVFSW